MPIFEYRCEVCGEKFEKIVTLAAVNITCKSCGSPQVEKLLSVFAVVGASRTSSPAEPGPCGACGAPRRGMCGE
jgi:putative FmdB family regulatory protein